MRDEKYKVAGAWNLDDVNVIQFKENMKKKYIIGSNVHEEKNENIYLKF